MGDAVGQRILDNNSIYECIKLLQKNNDYNIWKEYPVYPNSYKQETNNKRYWTTPDNGTCSPAEFCGTPYEKTEQKKDVITKPIPIEANVTRINWWAANTCT